MEKVAVRRINEWDAPAVLKIYSPMVEAGLSPIDKVSPTLPEMIQRIDRYSYGIGWLMCEIDSTPAGFCCLNEIPYDPTLPLELENLFSVEIQVYVKPEYQKRGVGTALISLMTDIMQYGNRREVFANIPLPNEPAIAFFEKKGFEQISTKNQILRIGKKLKPVDPIAETPTKPYLILNQDYEDAREYAATLVKQL